MEEKIKNLIKILEESSIDEIDVSSFWGKQRIRLKKNNLNNLNKTINVTNKDDHIEKNISNELVEDNIDSDKQKDNIEQSIEEQFNIKKLPIKAPLVGTYYSSPKPGDPPFISVGDKVKAGQVICIIEAMKIFNEIESDIDGTVKEILINDGTPVEYDQDLIFLSID